MSAILNQEVLIQYAQNLLPDDVDSHLLIQKTFQERLQILCDAIVGYGNMHSVGRKLLFRQLAGHIFNYILFKKKIAEGSIPNKPVISPIFIVGLPRSGTSLLQNLLSQDKENRVLQLYEALNPMLVNEQNICLAYAKQWVAMMRDRFVKLNCILEINISSPVECCFLKRNSLLCYSWFYQAGLSDSAKSFFFDEAVIRESIQHYNMQLQYLQGNSSDKRWLLKCPTHYFALDALIDSFPDAIIINTVRNMNELIPSFISLLLNVRSALTKQYHCETLANEIVAWLRPQLSLHRNAREKSDYNVQDIDYQALVEDPIACVQGIYDRFKFTYTIDFEKAMCRWLKQNPQHKRGKHFYNLSMFNLDQGFIEKLMYDMLPKTL